MLNIQSNQLVNNYFILSLSVADCVVGLIVFPLSGVFFLSDSRWVLPSMICQIWLSVDYVMCTASILNLTVLSVDRYLSIRSPLAYLKERTKRRAFIIIAAVWILSFTWILPIYGYHHVFRGGDKLITGNYECETEFHLDTTFKFITSLFNFWIPLSLIIFTYIKIFGLIRKNSQMAVGQKTTLNELVKQTTVVSAALDTNLKKIAAAEDDYLRANKRVQFPKDATNSPQKPPLAHPANQKSRSHSLQTCNKDAKYNLSAIDKNKPEVIQKTSQLSMKVPSPRNSNVSMQSSEKITSKSGRNTSSSILSFGVSSKFVINHSSEIKAAKQLGILAACFIVCWLPYFILFQVVTLCNECVSHELVTASIWLGYLNSSLNPLIYPLCNRHFKEAFKMILCAKKYGGKYRYTIQRFGHGQNRQQNPQNRGTPLHLKNNYRKQYQNQKFKHGLVAGTSGQAKC
ncbi:octopamine receptor beta-2R-like isoform X2 [Symsagittifera roscoffensis]|uniref:octopamine receptor beta-2R-like isoform X2 n=1 Tax=Symsagittifera roscoffensis TaxID=84072 RepID=UPI00307CB079